MCVLRETSDEYFTHSYLHIWSNEKKIIYASDKYFPGAPAAVRSGPGDLWRSHRGLINVNKNINIIMLIYIITRARGDKWRGYCNNNITRRRRGTPREDIIIIYDACRPEGGGGKKCDNSFSPGTYYFPFLSCLFPPALLTSYVTRAISL